MVDQTDAIEQDKPEIEELTPRAVLHFHMREAHENSKALREMLVNKLKSDKVASPAEIMRIVQRYGDNVERAIETAGKLAPYCHPKLEAIEVKSEVEHRFVIKVPEKIKSVEEWAKLTGAKIVDIEEASKEANGKTATFAPPAPSIHDFDAARDEIATQDELGDPEAQEPQSIKMITKRKPRMN